MLKTYDVTCPDCDEDFEVEMDPVTEEGCIECPECFGEFDFYYDPDTDTITVLPNEEDEIDSTLLVDDDEDDIKEPA